MKENNDWATKIVATAISLGVVAMVFWVVDTVRIHERIIEKQSSKIASLEEKIGELKEFIKSTLLEMKVDIKELRKHADANEIRVGKID